MIKTRQLSKNFLKKVKKTDSFLHKLVSMISGRMSSVPFIAVNNVTLHVRNGEIVGIVGQNGVGKTTLLRTIGNIIQLTNGSIMTDGRTQFITGMYTILETKLTVKENIYLLCNLIGLKRFEIRQVFHKILDMADIKEPLNARVQHFSTGTRVRLHFAIIMTCAEFLNTQNYLIDEIFAAGVDKNFQKTIFNKLKQLKAEGKSIIIVSHDTHIIDSLCDRVITLENK